MKKKAFRSIALFLCAFLSIILIGCGSSGSGSNPTINSKVILGINEEDIQRDLNDIKAALKTNIESTLEIRGNSIKQTSAVESLTISFMRGNDEVCSDRFDLSEKQIVISPNKLSASIDLGEFEFIDLVNLSPENLFNITAVTFSIKFNNIPAASMTYITNKFAANLPLVVISAGQSGGLYIVEGLLNYWSIPYDFADVPEAVDLAGGVGFPSSTSTEEHPLIFESHSTAPEGVAFKTIILTMGVSENGIEASNLTFEEELARIEENIEWARENDVTIIGMHVEKKFMRDTKENEKVIETVLKGCDFVITTHEGNYDGKFSKLAKENNIPINITDDNSSYPILSELFLGR